MAKPTALQRYYLFLIALLRWFGAAFAALALVVMASNLPRLIDSPDVALFGVLFGAGPAFLLFGLALYRIGAALQRRYRAHIADQMD